MLVQGRFLCDVCGQLPQHLAVTVDSGAAVCFTCFDAARERLSGPSRRTNNELAQIVPHGRGDA